MLKDKNQIYDNNRNKYFEIHQERLNLNKSIKESNKAKINMWQNSLFAKGAKQYRVGKLTYQISTILDLVNQKAFEELTIQDLDLLMSKINQNKKWSSATKADYRRCTKQFLLWFENFDETSNSMDRVKFYRHIRQNISSSYDIKSIDYSNIITEEEINEVITKSCNNVRDKALLSVLHEGGLRIGELLSIKLKDVEFKDKTAIIQVDGKTGRRRVPLKVLSVGYLYRWVKEHPFRNDLEHPLWIVLAHNRKGELLTHRGVYKLCKELIRKTGINKKSNPHWFRHSRATINATFMTESMLCKFFGWVSGSDVVRTYTHTSTEQVEDVLNKHYGLYKEKDIKPTHICCNVCQTNNMNTSQFCSNCGQPLTSLAYKEKETHRDLAFELMQEIMKKPELMERFMKFKEGGA